MKFSNTQKKFNPDLKLLITKYKSLIGFLLYFFILLFAYLFLLQPFYSSIINKEKEVFKKSNELKEKEVSLEQLSKLHDEFPEFSSKVELLDKVAAFKNDSVQFLAQLEKISRESGLALISVSPEVGIGTVSARLEFLGEYRNFKKFLKSLENNLLIIDVSSLAIGEGQEGMHLSLKVKVAE